MSYKIARYGWLPDLPDQRDHFYAAPVELAGVLPAKVDLRPQCPPVYDQGQLGSCFPPGTRVRMEDGTNRPIEFVRPLEKVLTAEGRIGRVLSIRGRDFIGDVIRLELWGHNFLRLTPEHPVLTKNRGYVKAKELKPDDFVAIPRYLPKQSDVIYTESHVAWRQRIKGIGKRNYSGVMGRASAIATVTAIPDTIKLTPAFGRIVGLFLAEGNTDSGKVVWTLGYDERDTLVEELISLLKSELGVEARTQMRGNSAVKVIVYGTAWAKFFESLCSTGAGMKRLHPDIASAPVNFMEAMFGGWMDGDGWKNKRRGDSGVSISHDLALSMFNIATAIGHRPSINWGKATQSRGVKMRQPRWTVEVCSKSDNYRVEQDETHCWRKVGSINQEKFSGQVFNLSVEGDRSYTAEGIGVHNCTANAIAGAIEFDRMKQTLAQIFTPSRLFIYYNERAIEHTIDSDSGAQIRDGIKSVGKQGDCPETEWPYVIARFKTRPAPRCYADALKYRAILYQRLTPILSQLKGCLASGYPFVFGFTVYESFESAQVARTGHASLPKSGERAIGGHAVAGVGYDDARQWFVVRNSWGGKWGMKGYFTLPYAYVTDDNLASDFWTIRIVQ